MAADDTAHFTSSASALLLITPKSLAHVVARNTRCEMFHRGGKQLNHIVLDVFRTPVPWLRWVVAIIPMGAITRILMVVHENMSCSPLGELLGAENIPGRLLGGRGEATDQLPAASLRLQTAVKISPPDPPIYQNCHGRKKEFGKLSRVGKISDSSVF